MIERLSRAIRLPPADMPGMSTALMMEIRNDLGESLGSGLRTAAVARSSSPHVSACCLCSGALVVQLQFAFRHACNSSGVCMSQHGEGLPWPWFCSAVPNASCTPFLPYELAQEWRAACIVCVCFSFRWCSKAHSSLTRPFIASWLLGWTVQCCWLHSKGTKAQSSPSSRLLEAFM